jgi:hypothetical protein
MTHHHRSNVNTAVQTAYMTGLLKLVAEKQRQLEDDYEIERTEDGTEEIVGKRYTDIN